MSVEVYNILPLTHPPGVVVYPQVPTVKMLTHEMSAVIIIS